MPSPYGSDYSRVAECLIPIVPRDGDTMFGENANQAYDEALFYLTAKGHSPEAAERFVQRVMIDVMEVTPTLSAIERGLGHA